MAITEYDSTSWPVLAESPAVTAVTGKLPAVLLLTLFLLYTRFFFRLSSLFPPLFFLPLPLFYYSISLANSLNSLHFFLGHSFDASLFWRSLSCHYYFLFFLLFSALLQEKRRASPTLGGHTRLLVTSLPLLCLSLLLYTTPCAAYHDNHRPV